MGCVVREGRKDFIYIFFSLKYINSFKNPLLSCSSPIVASFSPFCCQLFVVRCVHLLWTFHSAFKSFNVFPKLEYFFASSLRGFFLSAFNFNCKRSVFWFSFYCFCKDTECIMITASENFSELFGAGFVHHLGSN